MINYLFAVRVWLYFWSLKPDRMRNVHAQTGRCHEGIRKKLRMTAPQSAYNHAKIQERLESEQTGP